MPEVWYSSPYCTPEAEIARGNEDSWRGVNDKNDRGKKGEEEKNKSRVWVRVEPSTDSWALGILTYTMLTGSHPWAETASDCHSYLKYQQWFDSSKGPDDELDVWDKPQGNSKLDAIDLIGPRFARKDQVSKAPQFACFTPLACFYFRSLLNPRPQLRGRPEDGLSYLGGDWVTETEKARLEEKRKKSRGEGPIWNMKEMKGREDR